MTEIIRTSRDGCFRVRSNSWGQYLAPCPDPEATAELEPGALERFELHDDIPRIPADLWSRWVQLAFHFAHVQRTDLEVSCILLRHCDDKSQWRIAVPRQEVSSGSVRVRDFDEAIDITTGDVITTFPPEGWVMAGSSHSHHTMSLDRFSSIDDDSELGSPGLHIVLSHISAQERTYKATASITAHRRRFYLDDTSAVVDLSPVKATFHPTVLTIIETERPRPASSLWLPGRIDSAWLDTAKAKPRVDQPQAAEPSLAMLEAEEFRNQDDFDLALHQVYESIYTLMELSRSSGFSLLDAHAEVIQAAEGTFYQFNDTLSDTYNDIDQSDVASRRYSSPASKWLHSGDW